MASSGLLGLLVQSARGAALLSITEAPTERKCEGLIAAVRVAALLALHPCGRLYLGARAVPALVACLDLPLAPTSSSNSSYCSSGGNECVCCRGAVSPRKCLLACASVALMGLLPLRAAALEAARCGAMPRLLAALLQALEPHQDPAKEAGDACEEAEFVAMDQAAALLVQ